MHILTCVDCGKKTEWTHCAEDLGGEFDFGEVDYRCDKCREKWFSDRCKLPETIDEKDELPF